MPRSSTAFGREGVFLLFLLLCAARAAGAQEQQPSSSPTPPSTEAAEDVAAGATAILSAMANRAQQNSLSQTLMTVMALAATEGQNDTQSSSNSTASSLPPPPDAAEDDANNATTTPTPTPAGFRNALRAHLDDLVAQQQQHFVNALGGELLANNDDKNQQLLSDEAKQKLARAAAKLAERKTAQGPLSIQLYDDLVLGLGKAVRAASTQQPGAGPCGQYAWDAGGEYTPATWAGPTVSLSLSLGSCALVPSLEGPGAALTAGSAWTNAVGELACLGPGLSYFLSPLTYTSAGITGEALTVPACRLAASFGPSVALRLTRSRKTTDSGDKGDKGNGGGDSYASEGEFLAGFVLNGTLDKRIRKLRRAVEAVAGIKAMMGKEGGGSWWRGVGGGDNGEDDGEGGDYELAWEKDEESGEDGLQGKKLLAKGKLLLRALLSAAHDDKDGGHGGFENRIVGAASASSSARPPAPDALTFDNRIG